MWDDEPRVEVRSTPEGALVLTLIGDHDLATKPRLLAELGELSPETDLVIDLTRCTFIDSTVIGVILGARLPTRMRVALVPPGDTSYVYRALSVVGIRDLMPIHASVEAALASLASSQSP